MLRVRSVHAVVAIAAGLGQVVEPDTRRWLGRARLARSGTREEWLPRILRALDIPPPEGGLAALRYLEQTGAPPTGWIAAADPVWIEAGMNHLRLRALAGSELPVEDVRAIFECLEIELGADAAAGSFESAGSMGYFRRSNPVATAEVSPFFAEGDGPERYLPPRELAREHDRLLAEVQMCLHGSEINQRRLAAGSPPLNALWLWGGGRAAPPAERRLPRLTADDPVTRGYWRSAGARAERWPGTVRECLAAGADFVAIAPPGDPGPPLAELRAAVNAGRLGRLTLLFADGATADLRRADRLRFWRRPASLPQEP